jgi:Leucine-rich repeat (LRR) protein
MIQDLTPLQGLVNLNMLYLAENQIDDISPLVQNSGLGKGDLVDIEENPLDLTDGSDDRDDIQTLIARGVVMIGF